MSLQLLCVCFQLVCCCSHFTTAMRQVSVWRSIWRTVWRTETTKSCCTRWRRAFHMWIHLTVSLLSVQVWLDWQLPSYCKMQDIRYKQLFESFYWPPGGRATIKQAEKCEASTNHRLIIIVMVVWLLDLSELRHCGPSGSNHGLHGHMYLCMGA